MGGDLERPTPMKLCQYFFSDNFVERVAERSNQYRRATASRGDLNATAITSSDILKFFSIILYMGVVPLNNKKDYWFPNPPMPYHDHVQCMSYNRFQHIWYGAPSVVVELISRKFIHFNPGNVARESPEEIDDMDAESEGEGEVEDDDEYVGTSINIPCSMTQSLVVVPEIGDKIEVKFDSAGWFPGEVIHMEEERIQVKYADPEDPGPHWHYIVGREAIIWRYTSKTVWFSKVAPLISHVRHRSVKIVRFSLFVLLFANRRLKHGLAL